MDWAVLFCCSFTKGLPYIRHPELAEGWQGGQDSNLQQLVLETRTLPIELPPSTLSSLAMGLVTAAEAAVLAELQPVRGLLLIFLRVVVTALALGAGHHYHHACLFLCHQ
jgi:hypothetical protein